MNQQYAAERVLAKLKDYAHSRKRDVDRGLETAQLAGLIVQKYGYGLCDAFWQIFDGGQGPTYADVDKAVASIDPDWRNTQAKRWQAKADLDASKPRQSVE